MTKGMALQFKVTNQTIERLDSYQVYEKSQGYLYAQFIFSEDWKGYTKTIKFSNVLTDAYIGATLGKDNICLVPYNLILYPAISICVEGTKGANIITTNSIAIDVDKSESTTPHIDTPITEITSSDGSIEPTKDDFRVDLKVSDDIYMRYGTYDQLASLKNQSHLIKGMKYRLLGYKTIINGKIDNINDLARSQEYPFDLILTATSENTFSEEVNALPTEGDTYFTNSNLEAWKLWYCFDNDENRFEWASPQGQGVIYRMIDEFGNDLPYDFKSIQFKRYKITGTTDARQSSMVGQYLGMQGAKNVTYDVYDYQWFYTFNKRDDLSDLSLYEINGSSLATSYYVKQVTIGEYLTDIPYYRDRQALNDIVIIASNLMIDLSMGKGSCHNTWNGNVDITYNYFGPMCRRNILSGEIAHTKARECFEDNVIGVADDLSQYASMWNSFGHHFGTNTVITMRGSVISDQVTSTKFATLFSLSTIERICSNVDMSTLTNVTKCDFGSLVNVTLSSNNSGAWQSVSLHTLTDSSINIGYFYGSSVDWLSNTHLTQGNSVIAIMNFTVNSILGSANEPVNVTLTDLTNIASTRYKKQLTVAKKGTTQYASALCYTWLNIDDESEVINAKGLYSRDDGATWQPFKNLPDKAVIIHIDEFPYMGETGPTSETIQITSEQVAQIKNGAPIYLIDSEEERIVLYRSHFIENDDVVYRSALEYPYNDTVTSGYYYIEFELHSTDLEAVVYAISVTTTEIPKLYRHLFRGTCLVDNAMHTLYFEVTNTNPDSSASGSGPHIHYNTATVLKEVNECGYTTSDCPLLVADAATATSLIYSEVYQSTYRLRIKPAGSNTFSIADLTILGETVIQVL